MKVGDLVVNTYPHTVLHGKLGLVVGFEKFNQTLVMYSNPHEVRQLGPECLEVVSESR